jgi:hypothetical protein
MVVLFTHNDDSHWMQASAPGITIPLRVFLEGIKGFSKADVDDYLAMLETGKITSTSDLNDCFSANVMLVTACGVPSHPCAMMVAALKTLKEAGKSCGSVRHPLHLLQSSVCFHPPLQPSFALPANSLFCL